MKQSRSCHTCQRHFYNLMNANCGHKICFHCVKSNRNANKCIDCTTLPQPKTRNSFLSPAKAHHQPKQTSTKVKDSQSKLISQNSRVHEHRSRQSFQRSELNTGEESGGVVKCRQHDQPVTMYSKVTKDLICSVCVCSKTKLNGEVVPLRMAEQYLKKQNRLNREQAKVILGNIEHAQRIMSKNTEIFQNGYKNGLKTLQVVFQQMRAEVEAIQHKLKQQFISFFQNKFKECSQISQDLTYLSSILREYKQNNNEHLNFSELVYMFTSFKIIRTTIKHLDLDYIPYLKDLNLIEINKYHYKDNLREYIKLKLNCPLKFTQGKKPKSRSNKSVSRSKNEQWDQVQRGGYTGKIIKEQRASVSKKHQMSLCSNVHGIEFGEQEKNLYKMLLKTKFKL